MLYSIKKSGSFLILLIFAVLFISCSSAPERPMIITEKYDLASIQLEDGTRALACGDFVNADKHLTDAGTLALSIDNPDLLVKIFLSRIAWQTTVNGKAGEEEALQFLERARLEAERSSEKEMFRAVCDIYEAHILVCCTDQTDKAVSLLLENERAVEKEPFYQGFLYHTLGDALAAQKKYGEADNVYLKAAGLHTKNRYLQEIGHDWYAAASVRSLGGNKKSAFDAIGQALTYDRNAENTAAIASDYLAAARILVKEPATADDKKEAVAEARYAAVIYRAANQPDPAKECDAFAESIK
jgi:tetratricopeptide (TPR) repeat protein